MLQKRHIEINYKNQGFCANYTIFSIFDVVFQKKLYDSLKDFFKNNLNIFLKILISKTNN